MLQYIVDNFCSLKLDPPPPHIHTHYSQCFLYKRKQALGSPTEPAVTMHFPSYRHPRISLECFIREKVSLREREENFTSVSYLWAGFIPRLSHVHTNRAVL